MLYNMIDTIQTLDSFIPEVCVKANILKGSFLEYQTILTAFVYVYIFEMLILSPGIYKQKV